MDGEDAAADSPVPNDGVTDGVAAADAGVDAWLPASAASEGLPCRLSCAARIAESEDGANDGRSVACWVGIVCWFTAAASKDGTDDTGEYAVPVGGTGATGVDWSNRLVVSDAGWSGWPNTDGVCDCVWVKIACSASWSASKDCVASAAGTVEAAADAAASDAAAAPGAKCGSS